MAQFDPGLPRLCRHPDQPRLVWWLAGAPPAPATPVLVTVHGISRNAREQAEAFHAPAARLGLTVLAPLFDQRHFPDYQRLGRRGLRADLALEAMLAWLASERGAEIRRIRLFGFSGGAQFAHRFALSRSQRVESLVLAAAGWYTWLEPRRRFPVGIAPAPRFADLAFAPAAFLRLPILVLVGEHDDDPADPSLRRTPCLDQQQGLHRLARGRRWVEHLRAMAAGLGIAGHFRFDLLPASGHDFTICADPACGDLVRRTLTFTTSLAVV